MDNASYFTAGLATKRLKWKTVLAAPNAEFKFSATEELTRKFTEHYQLTVRLK